jgi:hypothetical protein
MIVEMYTAGKLKDRRVVAIYNKIYMFFWVKNLDLDSNLYNLKKLANNTTKQILTGKDPTPKAKK